MMWSARETAGSLSPLSQPFDPGEKVVLDERGLGFPSPPGEFPSAPTRFQAVLDQDQDHHQPGSAPGNGMSEPLQAGPDTGPVRLVVDRLIPER